MNAKITSSLWKIFMTLVLISSVTGCADVDVELDNTVSAIERSIRVIQAESTAWREELPLLETQLLGFESKAAGDVKVVISDSYNMVSNLTKDSIKFANSGALDVIFKSGVEFRCNTDFIKSVASEQLQTLVDDLKFWKENRKHKDIKRIHKICQINPAILSLYPANSTWLLDGSKMFHRNVISLFGYNFNHQMLPKLAMIDNQGKPIKDLQLLPAYITQYQIDLDFSAVDFDGFVPGSRLVFIWPDQEESNTISLVAMKGAVVSLSNPRSDPVEPVAINDNVTFYVTVSNSGDMPSGSLVIQAQPDPLDTNVVTVTIVDPIKPSTSRDIPLPVYQYKNAGEKKGTISLVGIHNINFTVNVLQPPPSTYQYRISVRTWDQKYAGAPKQAHVYITIYGDKGQTDEAGTEIKGTFTRGKVDTKFIANKDFGNVRYVKIRYDDNKENDAWHLDYVEIWNVTTDTSVWKYRCDLWFGHQNEYERKCGP